MSYDIKTKIKKSELLLEIPEALLPELPDERENKIMIHALYKKRELWLAYPDRNFTAKPVYYSANKKCYCMLFVEE